ncbi:MAG: SDR family NAD(P)-dependent oxidoreductase, partial [Chloroflexota bacterium]
MSITLDLSGKRALITGASSGIGLGVAGVLARAGCDVAGCGLDEIDSVGARAFEAAVQQHGRDAHYTALDVVNTSDLKSWVITAAEQHGSVDIVISNAGKDAFHGVATTTQIQWERNFQ